MGLDLNAAVAAVDGLEAALVTHRGSASNWDAASEYFYEHGKAGPPFDGFLLRHVLPLPPAFIACATTHTYKSFMGIFPEIGRAWVSSDTRLVLWSYGEQRILHGAPAADDFYTYDAFDQIIVTVSLVPPRQGVFVDEVQYLLAVATTLEVTLLGLTFSGNGPSGQLSLAPTNISVPTDGVIIHKIVSDPSGRIFMGGSDGNLHEFLYFGETTGWVRSLFGPRAAKKPQKIIHRSSSLMTYVIPSAITNYFAGKDELLDIALDPKRSALFTLSTSGNLAVYDISSPESARLVRSVNVAFEARAMMSYSLPAAEREFTSIFTVPTYMSQVVDLVVISSYGERIYFSCNAASFTESAPANLPGGAVNRVAEPRSDASSSTTILGVKRSAPDDAPSSSPAKDSQTRGVRRPTVLRCVGARPTPIRDITSTTRPCIHVAAWATGAVIMCDLRAGNDDRLITIFPDHAASRGSAGGSFDSTVHSPNRWVGGSSLGNVGNNNMSFPPTGLGHGTHRGRSPFTGQLRPVENVFERCLGAGVHDYLRRRIAPQRPSEFSNAAISDTNAHVNRGTDLSTDEYRNLVSSRSNQVSMQTFHTLAVAPVQRSSVSDSDIHVGTKLDPMNPSSLSSVVDSPSLFWVLTDRTMHLYEHTKPSQRLSAILINSGGSIDDNELETFFRYYGIPDAVSFCLDLATSDPSKAGFAARALYYYGGLAVLRSDHNSNHGHQRLAENGVMDSQGPVGGSIHGRAGAASSRKVMSSHVEGGRSSNGFDLGRPTVREGRPSSASVLYEGICIFLAQILHPVWFTYLCSSRDPDDYQRLNFSPEILNNCREKTRSLVAFLEQYDADSMLPWDADAMIGSSDAKDGRRGIQSGLPGASNVQRAEDGNFGPSHGNGPSSFGHRSVTGLSDRTIQDRLYGRTGILRLKKSSESRRIEVSAVQNIKCLATRCSEALAFLSVLADNQLHRIVPILQEEVRHSLVKIRFCDLVSKTPGFAVSTALIEVLLSGQSSPEDDLGPMSRLLRNVCPSYFDDDDVVLQRGLQWIRLAVERAGIAPSMFETELGTREVQYSSIIEQEQASLNGPDRRAAVSLAEDAVHMLKPHARKIYNVQAICSQLATLGAVPSAVELAIAAGDAAESGGNKTGASQSYEIAVSLIASILSNDEIIQASEDNSNGTMTPIGGSSIPIDGLSGNEHDTSQEQKLKEACLRMAFSANSDMFHELLYTFLVQSKAGQRELLARPSGRLEKFLIGQKRQDVLWKYFANQGRHFDAAGVLMLMAESDEEISLMERIGCLTRALHNAKTAAAVGAANSGLLLENDIRDFLDVANVQLKVREEISRRCGESEDKKSALSTLDGRILDLSTLYNEYAVPYDLSECKLEIMRCGSYRDDGQVREIWMKIVDLEFSGLPNPTLLEERIGALGRRFFSSEVVFPVRFVIDLLERRSYELSCRISSDSRERSLVTGWVTRAMVKSGVRHGEIVDLYRGIVETNSNQKSAAPPDVDGSYSTPWSWTDESSQMHILQATEYAVSAWLDRSAKAVGGFDYERRAFMAESEKVLRTTMLCKSRLRGLGGGGSVHELMQRLDDIEKSVQRLNALER